LRLAVNGLGLFVGQVRLAVRERVLEPPADHGRVMSTNRVFNFD
jgi:hypothetical protein